MRWRRKTATGWQVTVAAFRPVQCPHCGHPRLHRHDTLPARAVPHLWVGLRSLTVTWVPQRWRYAAYGRTACPRPGGQRRQRAGQPRGPSGCRPGEVAGDEPTPGEPTPGDPASAAGSHENGADRAAGSCPPLLSLSRLRLAQPLRQTPPVRPGRSATGAAEPRRGIHYVGAPVSRSAVDPAEPGGARSGPRLILGPRITRHRLGSSPASSSAARSAAVGRRRDNTARAPALRPVEPRPTR
jgi:hypothetical protein